MTITLGHRLIGKAAADAQQQALTDENGGGAIQLGHRLLNNKFPGAEEAVAFTPPVVEAVAPTVPRATANAVPGAPVKGSRKVAAAAASAPVVPSMSEAEVELLLAQDPNQWDKVAELEIARPEGWRPAVAHMILNAAPDAKEKPVPEPMLVELRATVDRANAEDTQKIVAAQQAAEELAAAERAGKK